jgi:hypothetical protein
MRSVNLIVIHCAATPNGKPFTAEDIDRWHAERGFKRDPKLIGYNQPNLKSIGYHYVIYTGGAVTIGRGLEEIGAHAAGHNANSIGTCLIGTDKFTLAQWASLRANIRASRKRYPGARVVGHRGLPNVSKSCPGFDVAAWLANGMEPSEEHVLDETSQ